MPKKIIHNLFKKSIFYVTAFSLVHFSAWAATNEETEKELEPFVSLNNTADDWLVLNTAVINSDSPEIFKRWDILLEQEPENAYFLASDFMYSLSFGEMERALKRGQALKTAIESETYKNNAISRDIESNNDRAQIVEILNALKALHDGKPNEEVLALLPQDDANDIALIASLIVKAYIAPEDEQKKAKQNLAKVFPKLLTDYIELQNTYIQNDAQKIASLLKDRPELFTLIEANDVNMIVDSLAQAEMIDEAQDVQLSWVKNGRDRIFFDIKSADYLKENNNPKDLIAQTLLILGRFYTAASGNNPNIRNQVAFNMADWISDDPFIQYNRSTAFLISGDYKNGKILLEPLLDNPALSGKAHLDYGLILQEHKDFNDAIEIYTNLSNQYPNQVIPLMMLAEVYRVEMQFDNCIPPLDKAIELSKIDGEIPPEALNLVFARGICLEREGDWAKAEADLKMAVEFAPDSPYILNYLAYSWADKGYNLDEAEEMLIKATDKFPNDGNIIDSLGWVYFRQNKIDNAVEWLERAATLEPGQGEIYDHLGDALWYDGRKKEATYAWQRAVDIDGESDAAKRSAYKLKQGKPVQVPGEPKIEIEYETETELQP